MEKVYLAHGLRTPFGKAHKGMFANIRPDDLLCQLFQKQLSLCSNITPEEIEEVVVGCAYPEGEQGYNVARMTALGAGIDASGVTINRLCGSSLEALGICFLKVRQGMGQVYLCGGVESMSRVPRRGANFSESDFIKKRSPEAYVNMGITAENLCKKYSFSREEQEDFACRSHELAHSAFSLGKYESMLWSYYGQKDELIKYPINREKIRSLPSAFIPGGTVTAATSSPLSDGASCALVISESKMREMEIEYALELVGFCTAPVSPELMGLGPVPAVEKLLKKHGLNQKDIAVWEINEAFSIQVLACLKDLNIPAKNVNLWGGALSLGHPLGASGLRLVLTLWHRLLEEGKPNSYGIATLCVGGGQGMALLARLSRIPTY